MYKRAGQRQTHAEYKVLSVPETRPLYYLRIPPVLHEPSPSRYSAVLLSKIVRIERHSVAHSKPMVPAAQC